MAQGTKPQPDLGTVFGAVLAGGKSSRMGSDKARLAIRGMTLLEYQFGKLVSILGSKNVRVSGNYPGFRHVVDLVPELGPLGGISSIIQKFSMAEYFLFLPVDMPNMKEKSLRHLIATAMVAGKEESIFNHWSYKNFEMPLLIKNDKDLKMVLTEFIRQPKTLRSVRRFRDLMNYQELETCEIQDCEFLNTNTVNEWKEANQ